MSKMMRRVQLSDFLKSCRARIAPAAVGLPAQGRRRTPGLRREDVAALAGLSVTWYTWLEQGRDVHASDRVLEGLSRTLRLTPEERDYLFSLAQSRPAPLRPQGQPELLPAVKRTLDALRLPALVMTPRWDIVYWNAVYAAALRDYSDFPLGQRNLMKLLMGNPQFQDDPAEYEAMARRIVPKLRVDYSQAGDDPEFEALVQELIQTYPLFGALWRTPDIVGHSHGVHRRSHTDVGPITFQQSSYLVEGAPALRVVIYAPNDEESARRLGKIADRVFAHLEAA